MVDQQNELREKIASKFCSECPYSGGCNNELKGEICEKAYQLSDELINQLADSGLVFYKPIGVFENDGTISKMKVQGIIPIRKVE